MNDCSLRAGSCSKMEAQHHVDWRTLFGRSGFRYVFVAMFVSLFGSGLNYAGVTWYILEQTHSTVKVSLMIVLVTLPGLIVPPFGGVLIDRMDRRRLALILDLARGFVVLATAALLRWGVGALWQIYTMMVLLGVGFAIYWSTMNALVQEIVLHEAMPGLPAPGTPGENPPKSRLATANTGVLIAVQGGMMLAGAVVGWLYERIHISGILAMDGATYLTSALCLILLMQRGYAAHAARPHPKPASSEAVPAGNGNGDEDDAILPNIVDPGLVARFTADLREGWGYLAKQPRVLALGFTYSCMMAGVISGHVVLVVLAQDVLRAGASGYGYLEFGWAMGAILGGFSTAWVTGKFRGPVVLITALACLAIGHTAFPYVKWLWLAVTMNAVFGACRAYGGVLTQTGIMAVVPHRLMGRTQSAFSVLSTLLQISMSLGLGYVAQNVSIFAGFALLGAMYAAAAITAFRARLMTGPAATSP